MTKRKIIRTEKPTLKFFPRGEYPELVETQTTSRPSQQAINREIQRDFRRLGRF